MKVEYEAQVPEYMKESLAFIIRYVREKEIIAGVDRTQLLAHLHSLSLILERPIIGTIEVEPEDVERDPYPIWEDMD